MCKAMFMRNANADEEFEWNAQKFDGKQHQSHNHPIWHRWHGGHRVRGHLSPMRCYQKQSHQKTTKSFKRMRTYKLYRRNSNYVLYNRNYRFRDYY